MNGNKLALLLRAIAQSVEKLDETELDQFIFDLRRERARSARLPLQKRKNAKVDPVLLEDLLNKLDGAETREQGNQLLDQAGLNRKELERAARLRDIHVAKSDDVGKLKEKLIEVIIGSRLNSRAIRGQQ